MTGFSYLEVSIKCNLNFVTCFFAWNLGSRHDIYKQYEKVGKYMNLSIDLRKNEIANLKG